MNVGPAGEAPGSVAIEHSDDERSIVTPELRLRFRRRRRGWDHAIDLRPGPWQLACEMREFVPCHQIEFREDGGESGIVALASGPVGTRWRRIAFRVRHRAYEERPAEMPWRLLQHSISRVEVEFVDGHGGVPTANVRYRVHHPPVDRRLSFEGRDDDGPPTGYAPSLSPSIWWIAALGDDSDRGDAPVISKARSLLILSGFEPGRRDTVRVGIEGREPEGHWLICVAHDNWIRERTSRFHQGLARIGLDNAPASPVNGDANRFAYDWEYHRVREIDAADAP